MYRYAQEGFKYGCVTYICNTGYISLIHKKMHTQAAATTKSNLLPSPPHNLPTLGFGTVLPQRENRMLPNQRK